jgi:tellurite methyltransferase
MLENLWRVLKPGGLLFCRLASTIGMPHQHLNGHRYLAPDGVERYSVDEPSSCTSPKTRGTTRLPHKTTVVQNQRCMTTWIIRKPAH